MKILLKRLRHKRSYKGRSYNLKKSLNSFHSRLLTVFSLLLFLAFVMIGAVFNLAVNQYIRSSAHDALEEARAIHEERYIRTTGFITRLIRGNQQYFFQNVRWFVIDDDYNIQNIMYFSDNVSETLIAERLEYYAINMQNIISQRMRINGNVFYFTSLHDNNNTFTIYFIDVTDIQRFAYSINLLFVLLVALIWFMSFIITAYLAKTFSKPLRELSAFARRIGRGEFEPYEKNVSNEEFEELKQSLNHAAMQLESNDADQKTFFANVSHELRTPLQSIKSYAEGIKYEIMPPISASETIIEATDRLSGIVDDILNISKLDNTTANMKNTDICRIIDERVRIHRRAAETKNITIDYASDGEIIIPCAPKYIERAIDNLLSNAMRYAKKTIIVECYAMSNRAVIRVIDDGPGFEAEALAHVFERFYKGKTGLTGIGLAMVRSIIEQHKGTATAENGEKKGAILTLGLPFEE